MFHRFQKMDNISSFNFDTKLYYCSQSQDISTLNNEQQMSPQLQTSEHLPIPLATSSIMSGVPNAFGTSQHILSSRITTMSEQSHHATNTANALRFPCKARGIDSKHGPDDAFIEVPANIEHGGILVCSNVCCASSGRRFRWCVVCKVPAAKRNFMKRHSHGLIASARYSNPMKANNVASLTMQTLQKRPSLSDDSTGSCISKKRRVSYQKDDLEAFIHFTGV
mmetsp:Transcript_20445/g.29579  ORF Transcript_20445/g.29579 Transcript_20445/m.29579 type:complete len:223 (+) Transcript_20445:305-973(+)